MGRFFPKGIAVVFAFACAFASPFAFASAFAYVLLLLLLVFARSLFFCFFLLSPAFLLKVLGLVFFCFLFCCIWQISSIKDGLTLCPMQPYNACSLCALACFEELAASVPLLSSSRGLYFIHRIVQNISDSL